MPYKRMFKKKTPLLISLLLVFSFLLPLAAWAGGETAGWEQFQKDVYNSGRTTSPAPAADITEGWRRQAGGTGMAGVNATPLVAEGKVFALDALGGMYAFEVKTGQQLWKTDLSCTFMKFQLATPAYAGGRLYVATNDGHVYALDAGSGKIIWDKAIADPKDQLNTPVKYADGKVYVGAWGSWSEDNRRYFCLDASSGDVLWQRKSTSGGGYYWSGACAVGDYLIFGDESAVLTCVDKDTGQWIDEKKLKEITDGAKWIRSSVAYSPETKRVYFSDEGGHCWVFDFDSQTGKLAYKWHKKIGRVSTSTPAVYGGKVYVGTGTYAAAGKLHCLNEATGEIIWEFTPTDEGECASSVPGVQASPSISIQNGKPYIYFLTNCESGTAYCLDESGNKLWSYTSREKGAAGGYTTSSVAIANGWAYFGNDGGWLYALTTVEAPKISKVSTDPSDGATDIPTEKVITVKFNKTLQKGGNFGSIALKDADGNVVPAVVSIDAEKLIIDPSENLSYAIKYTVAIPEGAVADSVYNNVYNQAVIFTFTTRSPPGGGGGGTITVRQQVTGMNGENFFDGDIQIEAGGSVLGVLLKTPGLNVHVDYECPYITGGYVDSINGQASPWGTRPDGWIYLVNGNMPDVGVALYKVKNGDSILWKWSLMGEPVKPGGPGSTPAPAGLTVEDIEKAGREGLKTIAGTFKEEMSIEEKALQKAAELKMEMVLKLEDGSVSLTLPPAAAEIKGGLALKITPLKEEQAGEFLAKAPAGWKPAGKIYEIKAVQKEGNQEKPVTWQKEVLLTISYRGLAVENERHLAACVFNEQSKQWDFFTSSRVDLQKKEVCFSTAHFSKFALMERLPEIKEAGPVFEDLPAGHWAKEVIEFMAAKDFLKGYPDGTCRPDNPVTRAEFAALLGRILGLQEVEGEGAFSDVQPGDWHYRVIAAASQHGLVKGYSDGRFGPGDQITREQAAAMLTRALAFKGISAELNEAQTAELLGRFEDAGEISGWAGTSVAAAANQQLVSGFPDQTFKPQNTATRAECAAMLKRLYER